MVIPMASKKSALVDRLIQQLAEDGLPVPELEVKFHTTRKWRFDLCWPEIPGPLAIEVDGGLWIQGRHNKGGEIIKTHEKYGEAMADGWRIYTTNSSHIKDGYARKIIKRLYEQGL